MGKNLGMDFRNKEDKKQDFEEYAKRIFPYGEAQKKCVTDLLRAALPKYNQKYLLMYYIMVKEGMTMPVVCLLLLQPCKVNNSRVPNSNKARFLRFINFPFCVNGQNVQLISKTYLFL